MRAHTSHSSHSAAARHSEEHMTMPHYWRLLLMTVLSFAAMYVLMYAMVDRFGNVFNNVNQVYMAGLMAAAMVLIELAVMGTMYHSRKRNAVIAAVSVIALVGFWAGIRAQSAVGDEQFLRSMIPHHAGAILMCEKAAIRDAEIRKLCQAIVESQAAEIRQMKAKLAQLQ
jgi:uncharacterized protein (DUF305 family)